MIIYRIYIMMKTLEEMMYINDGIDPFGNGNIYGRGGLGYKPTPYNMIGGMIGGMAKKNALTGEFTTEIIDNEDDEKKDIVFDDFLDKIDEYNDERINKELDDILQIINFKESSATTDDIDTYNVVYDLDDKNKIYEYMDKLIGILDKRFWNMDEKNKNDFKSSLLNMKENIIESKKTKDENFFDYTMSDKDNIKIKEIENKLYDKVEDIVKDKKNEFDEKTFNIDYDRGNLTEDVLFDVFDNIIEDIDGKKGNIISTKDFNAFTKDFLDKLSKEVFDKEFHKLTEEDENILKKNIFKYWNVDAIKYTTSGNNIIYEIKSMKEDNYNMTKFLKSKIGTNDINFNIELDIMYNVNYQGKTIPLSLMNVKELFDKGKIDTDNVNSINNIRATLIKKGTKIKKDLGNVFNGDNFDYIILNNRKNELEYANVFNPKTFKEIISQLNKSKIRLSKNVFNKLPSSYIDESLKASQIIDKMRNEDLRLENKTDKEIFNIILHTNKLKNNMY